MKAFGFQPLVYAFEMGRPMRICISSCSRVAWKWFASFSKRDWGLSDYPIWYREQVRSEKDFPFRGHMPRWIASIDRWPGPTGLGETRDQALIDLSKVFQGLKEGPTPIPRPGMSRPIVFAASTQVDFYDQLRDDLIHRVMELEWAFVSDESSLWDFNAELDNSAYFRKIWEVYGVDVSYIENGNIARILSEIMTEIREFPEDMINKAIRMSRDARDRRVCGLAIPPWIQAEDDEELRSMGIEP